MLPEEEREVEEDGGSNMELTVLQKSDSQENEQTVVSRREEYAELDRRKEETEDEMQNRKVKEMIMVASLMPSCLCKFLCNNLTDTFYPESSFSMS